jgi:hypothetical protein
MKALSVKQPWASMIARGEKTIETRTWRTFYRGPLLIVASKKPLIVLPAFVRGGCIGYQHSARASDHLPVGVAVCRCELINVRPMKKEDEALACCKFYDGAYAWVLGDIQLTLQFQVRGKPGLYDVDVTF